MSEMCMKMDDDCEAKLELRPCFKVNQDGTEEKIDFQQIKRGDRFRLEPASEKDKVNVDPTKIEVALGDVFLNEKGVWGVRIE